MRIFEFAKKENLSVSKILETLNAIGIKDANSNSKLDKSAISAIIEISSGRKKTTDFKEEIEVNILKRLPPEFKRTNPDKDYIVSHISSSTFEPQNKLQVKQFESKEIETYFNDYEAFTVCYGLKNRRAKFISRDYFERGLTTNAMEAHQFAMEVVSKYGLSAVKYLITLPELPFRYHNVSKVFHEFDKQRQEGYIPSFRIAFNSIDGKQEKLIITFYKFDDEGESLLNTDVIRVFNKSNNQTQFTVSRNGLIVPNPTCKAILPALEVFTSFSNDPLKMILHYGLETGECSICGRPLTDTESILKGIGPVCYDKVK